MKCCHSASTGRIQICPRVAKELEAGRAITLIFLIITKAQAMKRSSTYLLINECIWRHTFRKQSPERLDVVLACGIVYGPGCHGVGPEKRAAQVLVRRYIWMAQRKRAARDCAIAVHAVADLLDRAPGCLLVPYCR